MNTKKHSLKYERLYGLHSIENFIKQTPHLIYVLRVVKGKLNSRQEMVLNQAKDLGIAIEFVDKKFFLKIDGITQGMVADVAPKASLREKDLLKILEDSSNPLFVFLDEIQDPHNLGAILRSADATGVDAVIISKNNSVGLNATVRKVASGAAETTKLVTVNNLVRVMKQLKQQGMWMIGLAGGTDKTFYQMDFKSSVGIVLGSEGRGLRKSTMKECDYISSIPMCGTVASLNVSVAAAVTLYEVLRQRKAN